MTTKILTFNLRNWTDDHWVERLPFITKGLTDLDADFVALQEVRGGGTHGGVNMASEVQSKMSRYDWLSVQPAMYYSDDVGWEGVGIMSKNSSHSGGWRMLRKPEGSHDGNKRLVLWSDFVLPSQLPLRIYCNHFSTDANEREENARELVALAAKNPGPALIVGDLNAEPEDDALLVLRRHGWIDAWASHNTGTGWTFSTASGLNKRIDYQLYNAEFEAAFSVSSVEVVLDKSPYPSDHLGVLLTVEPRADPST